MRFLQNRLGLEDKQFWRQVSVIGIPVVIQNLISASVNMVDTLMIGQLGEQEIVAVGLANQLFFLYMLFLFGINSGAGIFISQFWGKRDVASIRRVQGLGLINGFAATAIALVAAYITPHLFLRLFNAEPRVVVLGTEYVKWVAWSYLPTAISFTFAFTLRSIGQPRLSMISSIMAIFINMLLNWVLIFGNLGFPAMGVKGAAIATGIARVAELLVIVGCVYWKKMIPAATLKEMRPRGKVFILNYYKTALPVLFNEFLWALGTTVYTMLYGRLGTGALAAVNIYGTVERISMVIFHGIGQATSVLVGGRLGAGDLSTADRYAKRFAFAAPLMGVILGLTQCAVSPFVVKAFNVTPEVRQLAMMVLIIAGVVFALRTFNFVNIVGILRSGGDTRYCLFLDVAGVWGIGIPMAFLGVVVFNWPLPAVYAMVCCEEIFKTILGVGRFHGRKWLRNLVDAM